MVVAVCVEIEAEEEVFTLVSVSLEAASAKDRARLTKPKMRSSFLMISTRLPGGAIENLYINSRCKHRAGEGN